MPLLPAVPRAALNAARSLSGSFAPEAPAQQPQPSASLQKPLPAPPPSKLTKRPTIWDKDHISETLAGIGQAFLSNQNFGEGLGAASGVIGGRQGELRREAQKSTTYGGPDGQFEITVDGMGNRTVRPVPEFAAAVQAKQDAKLRPDAKDNLDFRGRALFAISKLKTPEERQAAYADLLGNSQAYGIDVNGMPSTWSDTYGQVAGSMGMNVNQATNAERNGLIADNRIATNNARTAQGEARLGLSRNAEARAAAKASLPKAPPGTRKGYSRPQSRAEFNALPSGSKFVAPDGSLRIK